MKDYKCDLCFYSTSLYHHYQKHLETRKHKSKMNQEQEQEIDSDNDKETIKNLLDEIKGKDEEIKGKDEEIKGLIFKLYEHQKDINEELKRMNAYNNSIQSHTIQ